MVADHIDVLWRIYHGSVADTLTCWCPDTDFVVVRKSHQSGKAKASNGSWDQVTFRWWQMGWLWTRFGKAGTSRK